MHSGRTATPVPKRALVDRILEVIPEGDARAHFRIAPGTPLQQRIEDFTKSELLALLTSTPQGEQALTELERSYPLTAAPTLYLVKVQRRPGFSEIIERTTALASVARSGGDDFGEGRAVRIVYVAYPAYVLSFAKETIEVPLFYERKLEYTVWEPDSEEYGERRTLYSLERAFIWLAEGYSHGILCCSDFEAVRPLVHFGQFFLDIRWALPDLTEEMLNRLAAKSNPRSATFSAPESTTTTRLDAQTITVSDPTLGKRRIFRSMRRDTQRQQTAGFYTNHPDLALGGLGIARRYGRIWTPAHLSRESLVGLATGLVGKTEEELSLEYKNNLEGYVHYFGNIPVSIDGHRLQGKERRAFSQLVWAILQAQRSSGETVINGKLLHTLVALQKPLALAVMAEFDCPSCSSVVQATCPDCDTPYNGKMEGSSLVFDCPTAKCQNQLATSQDFQCDCGQKVQLAAPENHLRILPKPAFLTSLREFLDAMPDVSWDGLFLISGYTLRLLPKPSNPSCTLVRLDQLQLWRVRAHHHTQSVPNEATRKALITILAQTKEKCQRNAGHPTHDICELCLASQITPAQVENGELCLPRIMGLAIDKGFDGVHHGHEIADVKYEDVLEEKVRLAIHLKSRTRQGPQGLGRSTDVIKALYTQLFFSAYLALTGRVVIDVVGISVPNAIHPDVVASMQLLANELGFPLLMIDESDWLRILCSVLEQLKLGQPSGVTDL